MRDTFMKVGQSLLVKRQLAMEKQLKEKMIHSVMPPKVSFSCISWSALQFKSQSHFLVAFNIVIIFQNNKDGNIHKTTI